MAGLETKLARVDQVAAEVEESALAADLTQDTVEELAGPSLDGFFEVGGNQFIDEESPSAVPTVMAAPRGRKAKADAAVKVPGGIITYYSKTQKFTLTSTAGWRQAQGRPLGLLTAWLHAGQFVESKVAHWDQEHWSMDHTLRMQQRASLMSVSEAEQSRLKERECINLVA
eukprot:159512-Amphidinium_carterae.3